MESKDRDSNDNNNPININFDTETLDNTNELNNISPQLLCSLCNDLLLNPMICKSCQHNICCKCLAKVKECPFENKKTEFEESKFINDLLQKLTFVCKQCNEKIKLVDLKSHYEEQCSKTDFRKLYLEQKELNNKLLMELHNYKIALANEYGINNELINRLKNTHISGGENKSENEKINIVFAKCLDKEIQDQIIQICTTSLDKYNKFNLTEIGDIISKNISELKQFSLFNITIFKENEGTSWNYPDRNVDIFFVFKYKGFKIIFCTYIFK